MGYEPKIWRAGAGIAFLITAAAGMAEPAEPLTVTRLGDPESKLVISTASTDGSDADIDKFGRAISEALRAQQQSLEARCQSPDRAAGAGAARWAWEANCRYRRY